MPVENTYLYSPQAESLRAKSFLNINRSLKNEKLENEKAAKTADEFESLYFSHVIKALFAETEGSGLFGEGHGGELFKSIWINAVAQAAHSGLGISKKIKDALIKKAESSYKKINNQGGFYDLTI